MSHENGIERPPIFPFQTPQKLQPLLDRLQTDGVEREAFRIIAEREGRLFDPEVELFYSCSVSFKPASIFRISFTAETTPRNSASTAPPFP